MLNKHLKSIRYLSSVVKLEDLPSDNKPEIVFVGRSNVGKSTFINTLCGSAVAKTSSQPGKTQTLNFYEVGEFYRFVDMPGFGYAKVSQKDRKKWANMIEGFISIRSNIRGFISFLDIRRDFTEVEEAHLKWLKTFSDNVAIALTKGDKLSFSQQKSKQLKISKKTNMECFVLNKNKQQSCVKLERFLFNECIKKDDL